MSEHRKPALDPAAVDSLIRGARPANAFKEAQLLDLDKVHPNPHQPRQTFDSKAHKEIKQSIQALGILEPILVRPTGDGYEIVCGERRYRAAKDLGLSPIPAIIRKVDDLTAMRMAYEENVQREDLNLLDEARFLQGLVDRNLVKNRKDLATTLAVTEARVSQKLSVLRLPPPIQKAFTSHPFLGELHARVLAHVEDDKVRQRLLTLILSQQLSGRQTEAFAGRLVARTTPHARSKNIEFKDAVIRRHGKGYTLRLPGLPPTELASLLANLAQAIRTGKLTLPPAR